MKNVNKFGAKKREYALGYKFSELQTINKLKKMINLINLAGDENNFAYCYQSYLNDETALS